MPWNESLILFSVSQIWNKSLWCRGDWCNSKRMILNVFPNLSPSVILQGHWFPWQVWLCTWTAGVLFDHFQWADVSLEVKTQTWDIQTQWSLNTWCLLHEPSHLWKHCWRWAVVGCCGWVVPRRAGAGGWSMPVAPSLLPEGWQGASGCMVTGLECPCPRHLPCRGFINKKKLCLTCFSSTANAQTTPDFDKGSTRFIR